MKFRLLFLCFLASACTSAMKENPERRQPAQAYATSVIEDIPSRSAFTGWRDLKDYVHSPVAYDKLQKISFQCAKPMLYPTHPQQSMKLYHVFKMGTYDHFKLAGDDDICKIGNKKPNSSGKKLCFSADDLEYAVISDVYEDECGHFYRGYREVMFLKKDETMGSLFSAGRMVFQNPKSQYDKDMIDGHTYAVPLKEFLFLTDVFAGEKEKAESLRADALKTTHRYDNQSRTFSRRD